MGRISIKDVATKAGVSIATVSNVVNKTGHVSVKTIQRVEESIKELGFVPSAAARNLKKKKTGLIGVLVPFHNHEGIVHDNPFYWHLLSSIESASKGNNFYFILRGISEQNENFDFVKERDLDGLIIIGTYDSSNIVEKVKRLGIPTVYLDSYLKDEMAYQVLLDDRKGTYLATKHLIDKGHKRIALMSGGIQAEEGISFERWMGYKLALEENNLYDEELFFQTNVSIKSAAAVGEKIMNYFPTITGVVTGSDIGALGLINYVHKKGLRVPEDLSIVGFDNSFLAQLSMPSLTSIHQDMNQKGKAAIDLLLAQLNGEQCEKRVITISVHLVQRDSTCFKEEC